MASKRTATRLTAYLVLSLVSICSVLYLNKSCTSTIYFKRGTESALKVSKYATDGSENAPKYATNGSNYVAIGSKYATNGSKYATDGSKYATEYATNGFKDVTNGSSVPLLTVFTTWKSDNSSRIAQIQNNTIRNWSKFYPRVQFIVFSDDKGLKEQVDKLPGWFTREIPETVTPRKMPVLKYMFIDAMENFQTKYYCFINSDILYTKSFIETLEAVDRQVGGLNRPVFMTGQRWNVLHITPDECSTDQKLQETVKARAKLMPAFAADCFLTNAIFPWNDIPPVAIAMPTVDNFLMSKVHDSPFIGIDVTKTVLSVHQSVSKNAYLSQTKPYASYNRNLFKTKGIQIKYGDTNKLPFYTEYSWNKKDVVIMKRNFTNQD